MSFRIALAQLDPTVGDFEGNRGRILGALAAARDQGADLVVTPELAITGYPPRDLLERDDFIERNLETLDQIASSTGDVGLLVGYVERNPAPGGRRLLNAAALCCEGRVAQRTYKSLLPTYDVFDEDRYFEPGSPPEPMTFRGRRIGVTICEDAWNDEGFWPRRRYRTDPVHVLAEAGAEILVNLSASPYTWGKARWRQRMLASHCVKRSVPLVFVNQVGGNDDLIFDGHSLVLDASGRVRAGAPGFAEHLAVADLDELPPVLPDLDDSSLDALRDALVLGLADYARKSGFTDAVLGLSGGIDSALTAVLAARALGPGHVTGVAMPSQFSSAGSVADARRLADNLGIAFKTLPIGGVYDQLLGTLAGEFAGRPFDVAEENLQARIRGTLLMALSNKFGSLLLTTGNKSELAVGYCTLYGDMCGGLAVISDLPKTLVYRLARHCNQEAGRELIPAQTLEKPPSAELRPGQKDSDSLPPYETLDAILALYVEEGRGPDQIVAAGYDELTVRWVVAQVDRNEYKRAQAAPGLRVTGKAFGVGRRMPIVQRYEGRESRVESREVGGGDRGPK